MLYMKDQFFKKMLFSKKVDTIKPPIVQKKKDKQDLVVANLRFSMIDRVQRGEPCAMCPRR